MYMDKTRTLLALIVGLALVSVPTIAHAHAGNDNPNVVHACIGNVSKIVRIVGISGACITAPPLVAETSAHWDMQGPPGAPGANGTNGTNGVNGKDGTNGKDGANGIDGTSVEFHGNFQGSFGSCSNGGGIFTAGHDIAIVCNGKDLIHADPPCFDNTNRFVDCGNGTITDTVTGLIWLKGGCLSPAGWAGANQAAAALKAGDCGADLTDKSLPGDWRLPTKAEWEATIARAVALGCVHRVMTNDAGTDCFGEFPPSSFPVSSVYWSSSSDEVAPFNAWYVLLTPANGAAPLQLDAKSARYPVLPVRGGSR